MESSTTTSAAQETSFTPVIFRSGASNYSVTREVSRRRQLGERDEFEITPGRRYEFVDGVYVAKTADDAEWLRNYESFGTYYWEPESDNAPRAADSAGLQALIMKAALAGDRDTISDVLVAERSAESRPAVISACETALGEMGQQSPARPPAPLHEVERLRVGPAAGVTPGESPDPVTQTVDPTTGEPVSAASVGEEPALPAGQAPAEGSQTVPDAAGIGGGASAGQETAAEAPAPPEAPEAPAEGDQGAPGAPAASEGTPPAGQE
jgi:hypothetical protein